MTDELTEKSWTRRKVLLGAAGSVVAAGAYAHPAAAFAVGTAAENKSSTFLDILRTPDIIVAFASLKQAIPLQRSGAEWTNGDIHVQSETNGMELPIHLSAPVTRLTHVHLRWKQSVSSRVHVLGDQWERSYGDLSWRTVTPERVLPWYFLIHDETAVHGYGVKTGAGALCFWQVDPDGISLWLNVANGGGGVALGNRRLLAATVVTRQGKEGEAPLQAARDFCSRMCDKPRLPADALYGSNDWYYAYGNNSAEQTLRDADLMASCTPKQGPRPFTVIDDGWKRKEAFPDMHALADQIRSRSVCPGIWIRPLQASADAAPSWLLPAARYGERKSRYGDNAYDPTTPEGLEAAISKMRQAVDWGYDLVKHDFSTYELLGRWGSEMGPEPTASGWHFQDQSKTTAEIILDFYKALRVAAGDKTIVLGCNTVGHLGAGLFEGQRTGDDVSGREWERTRRMGVNTLAYRLPQNRTFFLQDADCVPITQDVAWSNTRQWLDLVARSGTALLISPEPKAIGTDQKRAIAEAFEIAAAGTMQGEPEDWFLSTTPNQWRFGSKSNSEAAKKYDWCEPSGAWPYEI